MGGALGVGGGGAGLSGSITGAGGVGGGQGLGAGGALADALGLGTGGTLGGNVGGGTGSLGGGGTGGAAAALAGGASGLLTGGGGTTGAGEAQIILDCHHFYLCSKTPLVASPGIKLPSLGGSPCIIFGIDSKIILNGHRVVMKFHVPCGIVIVF